MARTMEFFTFSAFIEKKKKPPNPKKKPKLKGHKKFVVCVDVELTLPVLTSTHAVRLNLQSRALLCLRTPVVSAAMSVQGRGKDVSQQCSTPLITGFSVCAALGGAWGEPQSPSLSPWEIISMSVPCNCCVSSGWQKAHDTVATEGKDFFYLSESSPLLHMLLSTFRRDAS